MKKNGGGGSSRVSESPTGKTATEIATADVLNAPSTEQLDEILERARELNGRRRPVRPYDALLVVTHSTSVHEEYAELLRGAWVEEGGTIQGPGYTDEGVLKDLCFYGGPRIDFRTAEQLERETERYKGAFIWLKEPPAELQATVKARVKTERFYRVSLEGGGSYVLPEDELLTASFLEGEIYGLERNGDSITLTFTRTAMTREAYENLPEFEGH